MGYLAWGCHSSGNCLSTKGKFFLSVEMYVHTFDFSCVKRIFEGLMKPITVYRRCILMYPYFKITFVARKLFKNWRQPWFLFDHALWFIKDVLRFSRYLSTVMWQNLIFYIFLYGTRLFLLSRCIFFGQCSTQTADCRLQTADQG